MSLGWAGKGRQVGGGAWLGVARQNGQGWNGESERERDGTGRMVSGGQTGDDAARQRGRSGTNGLVRVVSEDGTGLGSGRVGQCGTGGSGPGCQ